MSSTVTIGIAEMGIGKAGDQLVTFALGSCIGVCLWDANTKTGGMVHIMLPSSTNTQEKTPFKYANTGILAMVKKMESMGIFRTSLVAKIAGGAKMFDIPGDSAVGSVGARNIDAVRNTLKLLKIPIKGEDLGKDYARTLYFDPASGLATVKAFSKGNNTF